MTQLAFDLLGTSPDENEGIGVAEGFGDTSAGAGAAAATAASQADTAGNEPVSPAGGTPGVPGDAAARADVLTGLDRSLFVEAGAGTGKTTALVGRVLALVTSGKARLSRIAAITFTEAAAAELRDRVYEALEQAAAGNQYALRAD
ncbi:MAG TPA: UvrD-helicase domain-containing protein, partial [Acidimicrobiales bacterium]